MFRGCCRVMQHPMGALSLYCFLLLLLLPPLLVFVDETTTPRFIFCSAFSITTPARTPRQTRDNRPDFLLSFDTNCLRTQQALLYATAQDDDSDFTFEGPSSSTSTSDSRKLEPVQDGNIMAAAAVELPRDPRRRRSGQNQRTDKNVGGYDPSERLGRGVDVGDPQIIVKEKERSVTSILKELAAIQQQGPQKYCILGTRHCSYLHQQIIELLAYALVLSGNHVYTSGAGGTHAATIRGALRAERPDLLTVVLPQSMGKQTKESQELLERVDDVIAMPQNDEMSLDIASRICNSYLLSQTDQLISFAFHESTTVIEATKEAKKLDLLVTVLYLD